MWKITIGVTWPDNRFVVWKGVRPYKAFDSRAEAEAFVASQTSELLPEGHPEVSCDELAMYTEPAKYGL